MSRASIRSWSTRWRPRATLTRRAPAFRRWKRARVEDVLGLGREGEEADQDVEGGEEGVEAGLAGVGGDALELARGAAPAGDVEAVAGEEGGGVLAEDAEAHDADGGRGGGAGEVEAPLRAALLGGVEVEVAVVLERLEEDELAHAAGERGVDHAAQGEVRQGRVAQHGVDAGGEREDGAQVRQAGQHAGRGQPDEGGGDVGGVAEVGPDADVEAGAAGEELLPPELDGVVRAVDEERHRGPRGVGGASAEVCGRGGGLASPGDGVARSTT